MTQPELPKSSDAPADETAFDVSLVDGTAEPEQVELVPIAPPPIDPLQMDVTLATDPLPQMDRLERSRWRWRFVALVSLAAFAIIVPVSLLQFWGTFLTCQMLTEARLDAERARDETARTLEKSQKLYETVVMDRREAMALRSQMSILHDQWEQVQPRFLESRDGEAALAVKRQVLIDTMTQEAERMLEEIRRQGQEHAAFLEGVIYECYHGEGANPLVPMMPKPAVED